jgi:hypothetical protein
VGLRPVHIYLLFFAWTLFSVFIYTRYSTLGDSQSYLTGAYAGEDRAARTLAITALAEAVYAVVRVPVLAHMVFSAFAATGVVYMARQARLHGRYQWPLLAILLIPNFGVWASAVGRESLFVGMLGLFMGALLSYYRRPTFNQFLLGLSCVAGMVFVRAPFGIGALVLLLMFLLYRSGPRTGFTVGVQALFFVVTALVVLGLAWPYLDAYITGDVLPKAEGYFTVHSETTRTAIELDTTVDLITSLWWSLPLALVGPTPAEVMERPLMLPFFLSGLVVLGSVVYAVALAFRAPRGRVRKILLLGWLPALAVMLFAYVPFGIYNPGSAIRYASCFLLFLTFPAMLLSTVSAQSRPAEAPPIATRGRSPARQLRGGIQPGHPAQ